MTTPTDLREDPIAVSNAVVRAADELRHRNRLLGLPLVVWREGRVLHVDAETLQPSSWPTAVGEGPPPLPPQS